MAIKEQSETRNSLWQVKPVVNGKTLTPLVFSSENVLFHAGWCTAYMIVSHEIIFSSPSITLSL